MNHAPDPRVTPARPDLAAAHLEGKVAAPRYVEGREMTVTVALAALKGRPDAAASMTSELLFGESFTVYDIAGGWAWGQAAHDGYVGYMEARCLGPAALPPTHWVARLSTHLYPAADLKTPPLTALYLGSRVRVVGEAVKGFVAVDGGGFVYAAHLRPLDADDVPDPTALAESFLGAPYLWGGRTVAGIDCSGLVQQVMMAACIPCPRDSDQQAAAVGERLAEEEALARGDIVFFPGHVGIMVDALRLLHANATHMAVTIDPLETVAGIVAKDLEPGRPVITARRRLRR